jgi:hypothetical protein
MVMAREGFVCCYTKAEMGCAVVDANDTVGANVRF